MAFYNDPDIFSLLVSRELGQHPDPPAKTMKSFGGMVTDFLKSQRRHIEALVWDVQQMDKFDKAFMAFAGQPLIIDTGQAFVQSIREAALAQPLDWRKNFLTNLLSSGSLDSFHAVTSRNFDRLMHTGQMQEAMEGAGLWKNLAWDIPTGVVLGKVTGRFFDELIDGIKKIGTTREGWRDSKLIKNVLGDSIKKSETFRDAELKMASGTLETEARQLAKIAEEAGTIKPTSFYNNVMDGVSKATQFWKDTVLIYRPASTVRNALDNTMKSINEMVNSAVRGKPFWAFQTGKGLKFFEVDEKLFAPTFGEAARGLEKVGANWASNLRENLYKWLLVKPEQWARKGVYCGKLKRFEKDVFEKLAVDPAKLDDLKLLASERSMAEVNRIFFDYSKRLSKSRVVNNIFPFFDYNVKNAEYWLHDFAHNPWKLNAIVDMWDFWTEQSGRNVDFRIKNKLPVYVIPGIYFDPFSFTSAKNYLEVFSKAIRAKPKWLEASNHHYEHLYKILKNTPELQARLASNKGFREWEKTRKHRFRWDVINYVDKYLGLSPLVRRGLEGLLIAEPEPWRKMFPQSDLIDAIGTKTIESWKQEAMREITDGAVKHEMKAQAARGEIPDEVRASETLVNWAATKNIIGFIWGSYFTRDYQNVHSAWSGMLTDVSAK